jgi:putative endonuclease
MDKLSSFYVYVLRSKISGKFYKGHCEDIDKRLSQHNAGVTKSTRKGIPWELVYFETFANRDEAIHREKYFKSAAGRRYLKTKLSLW